MMMVIIILIERCLNQQPGIAEAPPGSPWSGGREAREVLALGGISGSKRRGLGFRTLGFRGFGV